MTTATKSPSTTAQIDKLTQALQELQDKQTAAHASIESAQAELVETDAAIDAARDELARLHDQAALEAREEQISQTVRQLRPLVEQYNRKAVELFRLARQIQSMGQGPVLDDRAELLKCGGLPFILQHVGVEKIMPSTRDDLYAWAGRTGALGQHAAQINRELES